MKWQTKTTRTTTTTTTTMSTMLFWWIEKLVLAYLFIVGIFVLFFFYFDMWLTLIFALRLKLIWKVCYAFGAKNQSWTNYLCCDEVAFTRFMLPKKTRNLFSTVWYFASTSITKQTQKKRQMWNWACSQSHFSQWLWDMLRDVFHRSSDFLLMKFIMYLKIYRSRVYY